MGIFAASLWTSFIDVAAVFSDKRARRTQEWAFLAVLITKCPIANLFSKKVLMLYNDAYGR
jgi:hypothetical protein